MSKLGNTLAMLKILENGRKYTVNELASKIEVSPRMIKSYKADLEKAGIYIDTISGLYGGYVYNKKNNYDVSFNMQDVNCLEKVISKLDNKDEVEQLLEKIKTIVIYSNNTDISGTDSQDLKNKYNLVSRAIKEKLDLEILYLNKIKIVMPHHIVFYKNCIHFTGYSKTDEDLRTYNLGEIEIKIK